MLEWLFASIDASRAHQVGFEISWHARLMVMAWAFLIPMGVISARFFKVTPKQNWPQELDNRSWWFAHLFFQYTAVIFIIIAVALIWQISGLDNSYSAFWHRLFGWTTVVLCGLQVTAGWLRGTKGGPTEIERTGTIRGDHYDMTPRRLVFEVFHKTFGYLCLGLSIIAVFSGLWLSNAPRWMWLIIGFWWIGVIGFFVIMQKRGHIVDTYEAIWGPEPELPGNKDKAN